MNTRLRAFTLIELLAAVSVFGLMLLITARIFSDSTRAMEIGMHSAEVQSNGRAVMDFVARELSAAVVDETVQMKKFDFSPGAEGALL